jgi:hypothetical protein
LIPQGQWLQFSLDKDVGHVNGIRRNNRKTYAKVVMLNPQIVINNNFFWNKSKIRDVYAN